MFDLIHTYILVLLKKYKNNNFVDNFFGIQFYRLIIDSGPFNRVYLYERKDVL